MKAWVQIGTGISLAALYFVVLLETRHGVGFTRDEGYYFHATDDYTRWFEEAWKSFKKGDFSAPFTDRSISRHWRYNSEHPALIKTLFVASRKIFHEWTGLLNRSSACRLVGMLFASLAVFLTYMLALRFINMRAAIAAALFFGFLPRWFFHAHLACFDVPIAAMWLLVVYAFYRAMESRAWAWLSGPIFGLALATKHNAFFLPAILVTYFLCKRLHGRKLSLWPLFKPFPWVFVSMALLAPALYFLHWPWLWHDTLDRLRGYLAFHLHHENYTTTYFGTMLYYPPFPVLFPFVMTAFTTEPPLLLLFFAGLVALVARFARRDDDAGIPKPEALLVLLNALVPISIIALPSTPVFGGVKHWFPSMPFLCLGAALALEHAYAWIGQAAGKHLPNALSLLFVLLTVLPSVKGIAHTHPYGLSYYSSFAAGVRGAAAMGFQRQFWGYANAGVNRWIDENAKAGALVYLHNANFDAFHHYKRDGFLRQDLRYAWDYKKADMAVFHYMHEFADVQNGIFRYMHTMKPATGVYIDEVPIIEVYVRKQEPEVRSQKPEKEEALPP